MKQFDFPQNKVALGQIGISVLLIVMSIIFSFMPIITVDLSDNEIHQEINAQIRELTDELGSVVIDTFPDKVDVTTVKLITAATIFLRTTKLARDINKTVNNTVTAEEREKFKKNKDELMALLQSKKGQESLITLYSVFGQTLTASGEKNSSMDTSIFFIKPLRIIIIISTLFYLILWPFILMVLFAIRMISVVKNIKTPEKVSSKISGLLNFSIVLVVCMALIFKLMPGFTWGFGLTALFVFGVINIVVNFLVTRSRTYKKEYFYYSNIAQGSALLALTGFLVAFFCLMKSNVINEFFGCFEKFLLDRSINLSQLNSALKWLKKPEFSGSKAYLADIVLVFFYLLFAFAAGMFVIMSITEHLGYTLRKKSKPNNMLYGGCVLFVGALAPFIAAALKNNVLFGLENGEVVKVTAVPIYQMTSDTKSALIGVLIGAILIIIAGAGKIVLKNKFCGSISDRDEINFLSGSTAGALPDSRPELAPLLNEDIDL